jgi:hypothetical protein
MKKIQIISLYALLFILCSVFTACDKRDYKVPEHKAVAAWENTKGLTRITIADLKATYPAAGTDSYNKMESTHKYVEATVIGNDESGNIYKTVYVADETGGIVLGVNLTGLFTRFPVGQSVIIELDGLAVGRYAGMYQIGGATPSMYGTQEQMDRMTANEFNTHVFRNNDPDLSKVVITETTTLPANTEENYSRIFLLKNVSFADGGYKVFADLATVQSATNRNLNIGGDVAIVRTSAYSNFAADTIPAGTVDVLCVFTHYHRGSNNTVQLVLRTREDVVVR